jgi:integrase
VESLEAGTWAPPDKSARGLRLGEYAELWLEQRALRPSTRARYRSLLDSRILPDLGDVPLSRLSATSVRRWYAEMGAGTPTARAHAYSLLRSVLATAEDDGVIERNPCRIRGAGTPTRVHRVVPATLAEIQALAQAMPARYRAMVLLAAWCGPRSGELRELRRGDVEVDEEAGTALLRIRRGVVLVDGVFVIGPTKSRAGARDVHVPPHVVPALVEHLAEHVEPGPDALLFPAAHDPGEHMQPSTLYRVFYPARKAIGRPDLRWHDLRHTGATLAAMAGATQAELMERIGHATPQAAQLYQHVAADRGRLIAERLSEMAQEPP